MLPKNSDGLQQTLFHEDFNAALSGLVAALGGAKAVGSRLYPDLAPEAAARRLLDALNPDRAQQLAPSQLLTLLRWGREAGYHGAMHFVTDEAGYTRPSPLDPEDTKAELQRQFVAGVAQLEQLAKKLKR
jgi:hypothetical protein